MEKRLLEAKYRFRPPKPSRFWQWALAPMRRRVSRRRFRVTDIQVHGEDRLRAALAAGGGVMFAVNHPAHGDPFVVSEAMHRLRVPCCYLAGWQVFTGGWGLKGWAFQRLGAFSIDREGTDMRSFRTAVAVLVEGSHSLVVFPEGEVYHLNDRVTPLREGAAMIALTAGRLRRRGDGRPLHAVPCALKYFYLEDPTPGLEALMTRLETRLAWRPRTGQPLPHRIYRYAEAILALKELEYLGASGTGPLPERIARLSEHILGGLEQRRASGPSGTSGQTIPARIKNLRQRIVRDLPGYAPAEDEDDGGNGTPARDAPLMESASRDLEDLHVVTQLFSYPGDYVAENPSIERIAETLDKFEEDALGAELAGARAPRRAVVAFGDSIDVGAAVAEHGKSARAAAGPVTALIEKRLQAQLDRISAGS